MKPFWFFAKTGLFLTVTVILAPVYFLVLLLLYRWRHIIGPKLLRWYSRICLIIFQVRIEQVQNYETFKKCARGILIVSNHVSFLDIFVLSSLFGSVFVSKDEVRSYPVIGQIAWLMGVIFLNRDSSRDRMKLLKTIVEECPDRKIVVFPQGTTSRISERLPFTRGIFKVVELNPDLSLLPVTLHYREDSEIAWYKQSLKENAIKVSARKRIHVRVLVHNPVTIGHYRGKTTSEVCSMVEETVLGPLNEKYE